jgi:hypothetical protein
MFTEPFKDEREDTNQIIDGNDWARTHRGRQKAYGKIHLMFGSDSLTAF